MTGRDRKDEALELLSRAERELVSEIFRLGDAAGRSSGGSLGGSLGGSIGDLDEAAFLRLARLRLRNIVEKHSEALKRARRDARSGGASLSAQTIERQLWICAEALAVCRRLHAPGEQG